MNINLISGNFRKEFRRTFGCMARQPRTYRFNMSRSGAANCSHRYMAGQAASSLRIPRSTEVVPLSAVAYHEWGHAPRVWFTRDSPGRAVAFELAEGRRPQRSQQRPISVIQEQQSAEQQSNSNGHVKHGDDVDVCDTYNWFQWFSRLNFKNFGLGICVCCEQDPSIFVFATHSIKYIKRLNQGN